MVSFGTSNHPCVSYVLGIGFSYMQAPYFVVRYTNAGEQSSYLFWDIISSIFLSPLYRVLHFHLQNDLEEFYAMVNFTNPEILGDTAHFRRYYQVCFFSYYLLY